MGKHWWGPESLSRVLGSPTLSGWLRPLFYSSYIWDMIRAFLGWGGGSQFPLMQPLTMASMKEIREEARGSPEERELVAFQVQ